MKFTFRQKIFLTYLFVFILFLVLMSPLASLLVRQVVKKAMENRAREFIEMIKTAPNNEVMVRRLKELKPLIFFRVSVIDNEYKTIYDTHTKRLFGSLLTEDLPVDHPEVVEAFRYGKGYTEGYSEILSQKFAYTAVAFDFHGKKYVIRTAFPYRYVKELIDDFEIGFLLLASIVLILFSTMTWFIIHQLTKPIQSIISAVALYKESDINPLPALKKIYTGLGDDEDVGKLAQTLSSLSERLEKQISNLRQERNEKEVLLESLVEGVIATDEHQVITYANSAAEKFLGKSEQELIGKSFQTIGEEKSYEAILQAEALQSPILESARMDREGENYFLDLIALPKKDNTGTILVMQDKTDQYRILEMRKDFIANASHELKTPITIIRGFAETLHDNPDLERSKLIDATDKIVKNCERMTSIIRDLLALADIENIPFSRIEKVSLIPLIQKSITTTQEMFPDAIVELDDRSNESLTIKADPNLIELAFNNLLQNGAKYSQPPAHILIRLENDATGITIKIIDQGIGIPEQDLKRIFERFYRVDKARSRKLGGSGLGLSIVETIVKKHYGRISVESTIGKGSTFTLWFPKASEE